MVGCIVRYGLGGKSEGVVVVGKDEGVKGVVVRREERRGSFCDGLVDEWEGNVHFSSALLVCVVMLVMVMLVMLMITMTNHQVHQVQLVSHLSPITAMNAAKST